MRMLEWWENLDSDAKAWLISHNGEPVAPEVLRRIAAAGGTVTTDAWWVGDGGPDGFSFSDEAIDWIESVANDETD